VIEEEEERTRRIEERRAQSGETDIMVLERFDNGE